jgi:hypothetical protein
LTGGRQARLALRLLPELHLLVLHQLQSRKRRRHD